jgi:hypothetical protein
LTNFLSSVLNLQTENQAAEYLFLAGFQFREEFLLHREDAAQRLQRFVHWEVSFLFSRLMKAICDLN